MLLPGEIANPKRRLDSEEKAGRKLFPYYAGFSNAFVESTLLTLGLRPGATVLDPWNGSGTTTVAAFNQGFTAVGSDLNPAMVLVAKATFVSVYDVDSLVPLAHSITDKLRGRMKPTDNDALDNWFDPKSAACLREIERRINRTLISHEKYLMLDSNEALERVTPLAAFFYLALFKVVRRLTQNFVASNPTWIRLAKCSEEKNYASMRNIIELFVNEISMMCEHRERFTVNSETDGHRLSLLLANSSKLPIQTGSVDAIITSPPYCTRIDYAVATYVELAVLGIGGDRFSELRKKLTGSSTVDKDAIELCEGWGPTCRNFLGVLYNHPSQASKTYYFKNHLQYFSSIYNSMKESVRVLSVKGPCVMVVQNSYYKEVRNDVATIVEEMASGLGMSVLGRADFSSSRSMVGLNPRSLKYVNNRSTTESVIFLGNN